MRRALNYKHLHYFWAVARAGGVSRAAEQLHLTPQTLSGQLKQLEESLGVALFRMAGKRLQLTEAGRVALSYADEMFSLAGELGDALRALPRGRLQPLRIGIADALPKSLAHRLIEPTMTGDPPVRLIAREGALETLLAELALHRLDLVLASRSLPQAVSVRAFSHRLGDSPVALFAASSLKLPDTEFPRCLHGQPLLLPSADSPVHAGVLAWFERQRVVPLVVGEFDDSALMKAFGRAGAGVFPAPVAIADEIAHVYGAQCIGRIEGLSETYFAITTERRVTNASTLTLLQGAAGVFARAESLPGFEKPEAS